MSLDITALRLRLADAQALIQSVALELEAADPNEPRHASTDMLERAMSAGERAANPDPMLSDPWETYGYRNPA